MLSGRITFFSGKSRITCPTSEDWGVTFPSADEACQERYSRSEGFVMAR